MEPGRPFAYPAACFVTSTIQHGTVPCLSAEQQVHFHQGYELIESLIATVPVLAITAGVHSPALLERIADTVTGRLP
ncbi:hypothetical protein M2283_008999 [Streptomyces pseudovenezuelae]|uniref:Uncharacterized protein n=1 Tax=Streptomyces pseudovenezuelae TaxID=67350 RepID=A0ABT6LZC6_9ACTN|nr:hypothetical protein [Streptomyces pseudovenezuelae]